MNSPDHGGSITRRQLLLLGVASAAAPLLPAPAVGPAAAQTTQAPAKGGGRTVQLRFLTVTGEPMLSLHTQVIERFSKAHPNIQIRFEQVPFPELGRKITTEAAAGNPPDVIWADGPEIKHLAYNKVIVPLEPWLYSKAELEDFVPQTLEEGSFKGVVHAIGRRQSCEAVWYNVDIMDRAGIKPPSTLDKAWTFQQWRDVWLQVSKPPEIWGVASRQVLGAGTYESLAFVRSAGEKGSPTYQAISPDGKTVKGHLDTREALDAIQFWQNLIVKDKVTPPALIPEAFETGRAACQIYPEHLGPVLRSKYPNLRFSVSPLPYFRTGFSHTGSYMYVISSKTPYRDEAGAFIKFISNEENSRFWFERETQLPVRKSLYKGAKIYEVLPNKLFAETFVSWAQPRPQTPGFREYDQLVVTMFNDLAKGAPVDKTVRATVTKIDEVLKKYV
jgi:ABC-type glycerol-3-phosphate transport system substrate-binding protein